jgi:hypothetical protein
VSSKREGWLLSWREKEQRKKKKHKDERESPSPKQKVASVIVCGVCGVGTTVANGCGSWEQI